MHRVASTMLVVSTSILVVGWSDRDLRGKAVASADGRTYLVIDDDNGGSCGALKVDGREWRYQLHAPGAIEPGVHAVSCGKGGDTRFAVRSGTTFHFDYWGP
jgi:hypothetical protein